MSTAALKHPTESHRVATDGLILAQSPLIPAFPVLELQVWVTFKLKLPHMAGGTDLVYNLLCAHYKKLGDVRTLRNWLIKHLHRTYLKHCIFFVLMKNFFWDRQALNFLCCLIWRKTCGPAVSAWCWDYVWVCDTILAFWFFLLRKEKKRSLFPYSWMQASLFQCCSLLSDWLKEANVISRNFYSNMCASVHPRMCVCVKERDSKRHRLTHPELKPGRVLCNWVTCSATGARFSGPKCTNFLQY